MVSLSTKQRCTEQNARLIPGPLMTEKWEKLVLPWILVRKWRVITGQKGVHFETVTKWQPSCCFCCLFREIKINGKKCKADIVLLTLGKTHPLIYIWIQRWLSDAGRDILAHCAEQKVALRERCETMRLVVRASWTQARVHTGAPVRPRRAQWEHLFGGTILHIATGNQTLCSWPTVGHLSPFCFLNRRWPISAESPPSPNPLIFFSFYNKTQTLELWVRPTFGSWGL